MGGGSGGGGQPYDLLGGQYASFSGGTPGGGYDVLTNIGKGLQSAGKTIGSDKISTPQFQVPQFEQYSYYQTPGAYGGIGQAIPQSQQQSYNIMDLLQRLIG